METVKHVWLPAALALAGLIGSCGGGTLREGATAQPLGWTEAVPDISSVERVALPGVERERLLAEDAARPGKDVPPRFAVPIRIGHTPDTVGTWHQAADGSLVWRLRLHSPGAYSLSLGFRRYRMPRGGRLYVYAPGGASVVGPFTEEDNEAHGQLFTPALPGPDVILEIDLPSGKRSSLELELDAVNHGYRETPEARPR